MTQINTGQVHAVVDMVKADDVVHTGHVHAVVDAREFPTYDNMDETTQVHVVVDMADLPGHIDMIQTTQVHVVVDCLPYLPPRVAKFGTTVRGRKCHCT